MQDYGDGMDRRIVATRLTRMFSSAKDGDQTKIGRFGIGFVSVFALEPDLVCIDTARGGEYLRVLCYPDLRYEIVASAEPIEGTSVQLIKRMDEGAFRLARTKILRALRTWCRFVGPIVRFDGEPINQSLLELSPCQVVRERPGTRMVVGYVDRPTGGTGYYNRGLTIWQGMRSFKPHVAYRIDSEHLEHTVSRDRVLKDERYDALLSEVKELARAELPLKLFELLEARLESPRHRDFLLRAARAFLEDWRASGGARLPDAIAERAVVRMLHAPPISLKHASTLLSHGRLHVARGPSPVTRALHDAGAAIAWAAPTEGGHAMLRALQPRTAPVDVDAAYCTALPLSAAEHAAAPYDALQAALAALLAGYAARVELGHLRYPGSPVASWIAIQQPHPFALTPLSEAPIGTGPVGADHCVVLNVDHPLLANLVVLAGREPELAAYLVAKLSALRGGLHHGTDAELARTALEARWTRLQA